MSADAQRRLDESEKICTTSNKIVCSKEQTLESREATHR